MWTIYGTDSPNVDNVTNPKTIIIGNFKPSSSISEADFTNVRNTFLCQSYIALEIAPGQYKANSNKYSYYVEDGSYPSNMLGYNRFNILHRVSVSGGQIKYEYDQCFYEWTYHTSGTNLYYFDAYRINSLSYSHCPAVAYERYTNNEITRNYVMSMQLIATRGNGESGIGVVRPLWGFNFSDINYFSLNPIQYILGPVIPSSVIDEWLRSSKEEDNPDAPVKPVYNPEDADQHEAESADWTWLNKFKIMNIPHLPEKLLIDEGWIDDYTYSNQQKYMVFNDENDPDFRYHLHSVYTSSEGYADIKTNWKQLNDEQIEVGHSVQTFYKMTSDSGYFSTANNQIDDYSGGSYGSFRLNGPDYIEIGELDLDAGNAQYPQLTTIQLIMNGKTFSIPANYPNSTYDWCDAFAEGLGRANAFGPCCICRCDGHYYLGGQFRFGVGYANVGLCLLCRIDALTDMDNHGGDEPGDPAGDGLSTSDMNDMFGDGTLTAPNATTENIINGNIGDFDGPQGTGTAGDGSAFNPDGSPRDPADYDGNGTGEKNSNPTDSHAVPNSHDGSMGNGTGDPHKDDEKIDDPASTIPIYIHTEGTVSGAGVIDVFTPSIAELNTFTAELLSSTVLQSIKNYFTTNPMDGIFGLHILPYTGFAGSATANPRIGTHDFTAALTLAEKEFITVDYGSKYIDFVYDGFENFAPYSDAKIFLPFLGTKDIDINIIQGSICHLKYNVSLVTGDIYAYMYCQWAGRWGDAGTPQGVEHLVYSWQGNCAATVPLSHLDSTNYISGAMQIAGGITSLAAGAAMTNPMAMVSGATAVANGISETGRTSIVTSGNISGMAAFMGARQPFFIISRPIVAFSEAYNHYLGQRSNAIQRIDDLRSGTYTVMRNIDLKGISATGDEITELTSILKGGFYK